MPGYTHFKMPGYTHYTDFLKDRKFIRWQLLPDEELDTYWREFIEKNLHLNDILREAIEYMKTTGLNNSSLSASERLHLLKRIETSIEQSEKKVKIDRTVLLYLSSCAAIALVIFGLTFFIQQQKKNHSPKGEILMVGSMLNNKEIQLVTDNNSISFNSDVQLELERNGKARIRRPDRKEETIDLTSSKENKLIVPYGKRSNLTLSDGSKVWLNSGSIMEFQAQFNGDSREIRLSSGEIYIEVASDSKKPFYVQTSDFQVKVYGTKFNISAYADSPKSVVLVEGTISLKSGSDEELFLSPSEQATVSGDGAVEIQMVEAESYIYWKNGHLKFDKPPMTEVLRQISRYYNLSFDLDSHPNLENRTCTGKIYLSENMENVMATIGLLTSTKFVKRENQVFIINEPN